MTDTAATHPVIFFFDNPRTCSQLLHHIFKPHPRLAVEDRAIYQWCTNATIAGPERVQLLLRNGERANRADGVLERQLRELYRKHRNLDVSQETHERARQRLSEAVDAVLGDGKVPLVKEHLVCTMKPAVLLELLREGSVANSPPNPTNIPDDIFFNINQPLFLIRHPALVMPSFLRAQKDCFAIDVSEEGFVMWTMHGTARFLFDHMSASDPIVVDAQDVVYRSEALCTKLCQIWGIDDKGLQFSWDPAPQGQRVHPMHNWRDTLDGSKGIIRPMEKQVDIDEEQAKWETEFGANTAAALRKRVDEDIADYEYLRTHRLLVRTSHGSS